MKLLFVSDIRESQPVDAVFMCAAKNQGVTKSGSGYLILKLLDRSGEIEGRVWDRANDLARGFEKSDYVRVRGQANLYQGKLQIRVHDVVRVNETEVAAEDFLPKSPYDPEMMAAELMTVLRGMKNPTYSLWPRCFSAIGISWIYSSARRRGKASTTHIWAGCWSIRFLSSS